jgi:antirestriction protein
MNIYVGTYQKYNNGSINGAWLDLSKFIDEAAFYTKCGELHKDEDDPEFMFQDYEHIPSALVSECSLNPIVFDILNLALDDDEQEAFIEFMDNQGFSWDDIDEAHESFTDRFMGNFDKLQDFTDQEFDELYLHEIPSHLTYVIDYDAYYHTAKHDYWISKSGNVFQSN